MADDGEKCAEKVSSLGEVIRVRIDEIYNFHTSQTIIGVITLRDKRWFDGVDTGYKFREPQMARLREGYGINGRMILKKGLKKL